MDVQAFRDDMQMAQNQHADDVVDIAEMERDLAKITEQVDAKNERIAALEFECEWLKRINDEDCDGYERQLGEANAYAAQSINELKRVHETERWQWQQELSDARGRR